MAARQAKSCLILTDPGVRGTGIPDRALDSIRAAGVKSEIFDGVGVEPTDASIDEAVAYARQQEWDCFVAIGGGSAIDTAKAVNLLTTHPGELLDFVTPPIGAGKAPWLPLKPLIAVPTTAGTGSESTTICVVDLLGLHLKAGVSHPSLRPSLAVVDPRTTISLPSAVTAASGMDVLSHALESYTSVAFDAKPAPEDPMKRPAVLRLQPDQRRLVRDGADVGGQAFARRCPQWTRPDRAHPDGARVDLRRDRFRQRLRRTCRTRTRTRSPVR